MGEAKGSQMEWIIESYDRKTDRDGTNRYTNESAFISAAEELLRNIWEGFVSATLPGGRIKDVSRRGGIVLDLFGGSGSTHCDPILQRWETLGLGVECGFVTRPAVVKETASFPAIVVAQKTRVIPAVDAVRRCAEAAEALLDVGTRRLFFKYCATFDGHPGASRVESKLEHRGPARVDK